MSKEDDFFKDCIKVVAGLDVKSESQAIAKEVVLSTIENLTQGKDNLIKYLEDKITNYTTQFSQINGDYGLLNHRTQEYEDILERVKSGKYE